MKGQNLGFGRRGARFAALALFRLALFGLAAGAACAAVQGGVELAPGDLHARDLTPITCVRACPGEPIVLVKDGVARLPIVYKGDRYVWRAARELALTIEEMTGAKVTVIGEGEKPVTNAPALYVGDTSAAAKAGLAAPKDCEDAFRVVMKGGSVFFLGRHPEYGVYDWSERQLDVRYYWPDTCGNRKRPQDDPRGKCVTKTKGLAVRCVDYEDRPVFEIRENWPYEWEMWNLYAKCGGAPRQLVHQPARWYREPDATNHLDIFQITPEGERAHSPMLCYGNPKTLEYYKQRIEEELAGGRKSSVVVPRQNAVSVSQWDAGLACDCAYCRKLYRPELGEQGCASPILWNNFTKPFAKWMKEKHPGWIVSILPYINTRNVTPGLDLTEEGNVEAEVTMKAVALYKNPEAKQDDEAYMRAWQKTTGRKVVTWHYSCWPGTFTPAPYVFGEIVRKHYADTKDCQIGTFINGGHDAARFSLSMYVWMRALWKPDFDTQVVYDEFCRRMFGQAEKPMRELVRLQEAGWNRPWKTEQCTQRNVYEISYPRAEVERMAKLLDEAEARAQGDAVVLQRLRFYRSGFKRFFKESAEYASGAAFEPFLLHKAAANPICDGKLDEPCWKQFKPRRFVRAFKSKVDPSPYSGLTTTVTAVWHPAKGVTLGFWFFEPATECLKRGTFSNPWCMDNFEIFIDPTGNGDGNYLQLLVNAKGEFMHRTFGTVKWRPEGVKCATHIDKGWWSAEVYVPFDCLKVYPGVQLPSTSANGRFWTGNLNRWRVGDACLYKDKAEQEKRTSHQRLNTRFTAYNRDPSAFSAWKFVELEGKE